MCDPPNCDTGFAHSCAAARYLIAKKYTVPTHLALEGTNAGGIMVGGAITQHPERLAGALDVPGETDTMWLEIYPNGPENVPEFGTVATAAGSRQLNGMDAYQHIVDGKHHPAVMGETGINIRALRRGRSRSSSRACSARRRAGALSCCGSTTTRGTGCWPRRASRPLNY